MNDTRTPETIAPIASPYPAPVAELRARWDAYQWFRAQGNPARTALGLARAERWAGEEGFEFAWVADEDFDAASAFSDPRDVKFAQEHGAVVCILYRPCDASTHRHAAYNPATNRTYGGRQYAAGDGPRGYECPHAEQLGSLWGIVESLDTRERDHYRRQVQAELAWEAMG